MIANDSEAPESWLEWFGWRKLVFGPNAHRRWHYTGPLGQPVRHVKWFIRSVGAPPPETAINLWHSLSSWATGSDPPWVEEWREAIEAEAEEAELETEVELEAAACDSYNTPTHQVNVGARVPAEQKMHFSGAFHAADEDDGGDGASTSSSVRSARALARYKRAIALTGFIGVYVTWALFAWFIFVCCLTFDAQWTNVDARTPRCMGCSSTSCSVTRRSLSSRAVGACHTVRAAAGAVVLLRPLTMPRKA